MPLRGLTMLVASAEAPRLRAALELAATQAALGGRTRLFLHAPAVPALAAPDLDDARYAAAGLPTRGDLIEAALDLGAEILLCQSGLALASLDLAQLDPRFGATGLVALLGSLGEDRLLAL